MTLVTIIYSFGRLGSICPDMDKQLRSVLGLIFVQIHFSREFDSNSSGTIEMDKLAVGREFADFKSIAI